MRTSVFLAGLLGLAVLTGTAYINIYNADFIWDDNLYVMPVDELRSLDGLRRIWFDPNAFVQYYPLCYTTFWIENHFWGLKPAGYHVVNVVLHAGNALLFWLVLRRLGLRGAWVAAAIFALHPVHTESVAWITERRNVLSALFYLLALLAYLRFWPLSVPTMSPVAGAARAKDSPASPEESKRSWPAYGLALLAFVAALLSKTVTCSLPAALVLIVWWRRPRLTLRHILPILPLFVVGAAFSLLTWSIESKHVGGAVLQAHYTAVDRLLIAGRAACFYLGKLLLPINLVHVYPRWTINSQDVWQYFYPAVAAALLGALWWTRRRIGKGPLVAALFYFGTLAPTLGFLNFGFMDHSLVADRFQYLPSLGIIALVVALLAAAATKLGRLGTQGAPVVAGSALLLLGTGTWQHSRVFKDSPTLWQATLAANPDCAVGHYNLATDLVDANRPADAIPHLEAAVRLRPNYFSALSDLGAAYLATGRVSEALATLTRAEMLRPADPLVQQNLGLVFMRLRQYDEAIQHLHRALDAEPTYQPARDSLNEALLRRSRMGARP
jgi:tetratricopeptide (TPR) repeat protein